MNKLDEEYYRINNICIKCRGMKRYPLLNLKKHYKPWFLQKYYSDNKYICTRCNGTGKFFPFT